MICLPHLRLSTYWERFQPFALLLLVACLCSCSKSFDEQFPSGCRREFDEAIACGDVAALAAFFEENPVDTLAAQYAHEQSVRQSTLGPGYQPWRTDAVAGLTKSYYSNVLPALSPDVKLVRGRLVFPKTDRSTEDQPRGRLLPGMVIEIESTGRGTRGSGEGKAKLNPSSVPEGVELALGQGFDRGGVIEQPVFVGLSPNIAPGEVAVPFSIAIEKEGQAPVTWAEERHRFTVEVPSARTARDVYWTYAQSMCLWNLYNQMGVRPLYGTFVSVHLYRNVVRMRVDYLIHRLAMDLDDPQESVRTAARTVMDFIALKDDGQMEGSQ